jgi:hypothetical protein
MTSGKEGQQFTAVASNCGHRGENPGDGQSLFDCMSGAICTRNYPRNIHGFVCLTARWAAVRDTRHKWAPPWLRPAIGIREGGNSNQNYLKLCFKMKAG